MKEQVLANISTNLIFYRRNRLLLAASIFILLALALTLVPAMFFLSSTKRLEQVTMIFKQINFFATVVTAGAGMLFVSQHLKDRSVKMVFTKPCLPETWLLSSYLSAALLATVLYAGSFVLASLLAAAWSIPFSTGMVFVSVKGLLLALALMAYVTFLSVIVHPVLAFMFVILFQDGLFYWFKILLASGIKAAGENAVFPLLKPLKALVDIVYMVLPTFNPFAGKTELVSENLRGSDADWLYLLLIAAYALALSALFYFLTVIVLRKKRYV
jgi:hypothetical protein